MAKIKQIALSIMALLVVSFMGITQSAFAQSIFAFTDGKIYGFTSSDVATETIVIPSVIGTTPVTSVNYSIYEGTPFGDSSVAEKVKDLDLSQADNLLTIGADAFSGLSITKDTLILPSKLTSIKKNNFLNCTFNKVVITGTSNLDIHDKSFKTDTKFIFPSEEVMNNSIANDQDDWIVYPNLTYYYTLTITTDSEPIVLGQYEHGAQLTNYDEIIDTHFSEYKTVEIKQGDEIVSANTILDGTPLQLTKAELKDETPVIPEPEPEPEQPEIQYYAKTIEKTYKEECILSTDEVGSYFWKCGEEIVSQQQSLTLNLEAGEYTYILEVKDNDTTISITTFNITISPISITYPWGDVTTYEYYNIINHDFLDEDYIDIVKEIEIYKEAEKVSNYSIGSFTAKAILYDNKNYNIVNNSFNFTIDYTYLDISWDCNTFNYDTKIHEPKYTLSGNTYNKNITLQPGENSISKASAVGTYTIYMDKLNDDYIKLSPSTPSTFVWSIIPSQLEIVWGTNQFTYNGQAHSPTAKGKFGTDVEIDLVVTCTEDIINANTYTITASVPNEYAEGFTLGQNNSSTCVVSQILLDISFNCLSTYVYTGSNIEVIPTINTSTIDEIVLTLTDNKHKDVGNYTCLVVSVNNNNYKIPDDLSFSWSITPILINYPWGNITTFEYYNIINHNFLNEDYLDLVKEIEIYKGADKVSTYSIGSFTAKAILYDNNNYNIVNNSFNFTIDYTYLDISWIHTTFNYTAKPHHPEYTLLGNTYNKDIKLIPSENSVSQATAVGTYTIYLEKLSDQYFKLKTSIPSTFVWKIIPTQLEIIWDSNQFPYNGQAHTPTAKGKFGTEVLIDLVVSCAEEIIDADTYTINANIPEEHSEGFTLGQNTTSTCVVVKTLLDITFNCPSSYVYSGSEIEIVPTINTSPVADIILTLTDNKHKDAGNYTCVITGINNDNYILPDDLSFRWSITPRPVTVDWKSSSYEYTTYIQIPRPSVNTGIAGETLQLTVTCDDNIYVNEDNEHGYPISVSINNPNYTLTNPNSEYYITRAQAYITVPLEAEFVYNGEYILPDFDFTGDYGYLQIFVNGVRSDNGVKEPGVYQLKFSSPQSPNYKSMDPYYCNIRIKKASIEQNIDTTTITATNTTNGFYEDNMSVVEVKDYENKSLNVENGNDYDIYKVFTVNNLEDEENNSLTIEIENIKASRLRIFVLEGDSLVEKEVTITDNKASFEGGNGTYFILLAKPKWISTPVGILTIVAILLIVCIVMIIPIFKKPSSLSLEKQIQKEVKKRIDKKIEVGEEINDNTIKNLRNEVINELNDKSEKTE